MKLQQHAQNWLKLKRSKSPWKWETGDKLMLVITNAGQKTVHTLTLKSTKRDGLSGEFEASGTSKSHNGEQHLSLLLCGQDY